MYQGCTMKEREQKLATTHWKSQPAVWVKMLLRPYLEITRLMNRTDYRTPLSILNKAEAIAIQERCHSKQSELWFHIVYCNRVKHHTAYPESALNTECKGKTLLDDEVPVVNISQEIFGYAPMADAPDVELYEESRDTFTSFILVVHMTAGVLGNIKAWMMKLIEFSIRSQLMPTVARRLRP